MRIVLVNYKLKKETNDKYTMERTKKKISIQKANKIMKTKQRWFAYIGNESKDNGCVIIPFGDGTIFIEYRNNKRYITEHKYYGLTKESIQRIENKLKTYYPKKEYELKIYADMWINKMKDISITQTIKEDLVKLRISIKKDNKWTQIKDLTITSDGDVKVYDIQKWKKSFLNSLL